MMVIMSQLSSGRRRLATSYSTDLTAFLKSCNLKNSLERLRRAMQSDTQPLESAPLDSGQSPAEPQKTRAQMSQVFEEQGTRVAADQPRVGQVPVRQLIPMDILVEVWGRSMPVTFGCNLACAIMRLCHCQSFCFPGVRCLIDFSILFPVFSNLSGPSLLQGNYIIRLT